MGKTTDMETLNMFFELLARPSRTAQTGALQWATESRIHGIRSWKSGR